PPRRPCGSAGASPSARCPTRCGTSGTCASRRPSGSPWLSCTCTTSSK
ncbi:unnamed protein product, partial [Heterosigma akashiwo]